MVTTIRLPDTLHEALKAKAEEKGLTVNAYLIGVLWAAVEGEKER